MFYVCHVEGQQREIPFPAAASPYNLNTKSLWAFLKHHHVIQLHQSKSHSKPTWASFLDESFTWDLNTVLSHWQVLSLILSRSFNSPNVRANYLVKGKVKLIKIIEENQSYQQFAKSGKSPEICLRLRWKSQHTSWSHMYKHSAQ